MAVVKFRGHVCPNEDFKTSLLGLSARMFRYLAFWLDPFSEAGTSSLATFFCFYCFLVC